MALTRDIPTTRFGVPGDGHQPLSFPVGASQKPFGGAVAVTYNGYLIAASTPSSDQLVVGIMQRTADNSGNGTPDNRFVGDGTAGSIVAEVETGTFFLFGGTNTDALTQADVNKTVYLIDEKTVGKTNGSSTRPVAGTLRAIDTTRAGGDQYAVTLGTVANGLNVTP
jgi:hypothetical protein